MTLGTVGFGRSFPRMWIAPVGILIVLFGLAITGVLSRAIVADFLAWWPIWVGLAVAAVVLRERKFGRFRASGLVPLVAILMVGLFALGHLAGWSLMPSATQRLVGPTTANTVEASLSASIEGTVDLAGGADEFLYLVEPANGGGRFGIPSATEESLDSAIDVDLIPTPDPGLYTYSGWAITLATKPVWTLDLDGVVNADFTGLVIDTANVDGVGTVVLSGSSPGGVLNVDGQYEIVWPTNTPASLSGVASVPDTWSLTSTGAESPAGAAGGWIIVVAAGASVRVTEG